MPGTCNDIIAGLQWDYSTARPQPEIAKHRSVIVSFTLVLERKLYNNDDITFFYVY